MVDVPNLLVTRGSFDSSSSSSDSDEDEATGALFQKYSTTPPTRSFMKLKRSSKLPNPVTSYSLDMDNKSSSTTSAADGSSSSRPKHMGSSTYYTHKWRQKENSRQRLSDRKIKWHSADAAAAGSPRALAGGEASGASDDDNLNDKSLNQRIKVESRNRFMSLCSRLIKLPRKLRSRSIDSLQNPMVISCQSRAEFQSFFADLMKTAGTNLDSKGQHEHHHQREQHEKREEELIWQSELKDLLWLELQAWLSDRTPQEQDSYLYIQRQRIPDVLNRIMDYHFEAISTIRRSTETNLSDAISLESVSCSGCLDAFCEVCALNLSKALYEVSNLLKELESVEELYPSGRSLGYDYPLYASTSFTDRIKTLCLWYNVTYLLQLKIDIIGHMLVSLGSKGLPWPAWPAWPPTSPDHDRDAGGYFGDVESTDEALSISAQQQQNQATAAPSVAETSTKKKPTLNRDKSRVQFFVEGDSTHNQATARGQRMEDSPADSVKSEYSGPDLPEADSELSRDVFTPESPTDVRERPRLNNNRPVHYRCDSYGNSSETDSDFSKLSAGFETHDGRLLYRSYIERALKSRGLRKMLRWMFFIHRVNMVRAKAALSLNKGDSSSFLNNKNASSSGSASASSSPFLFKEEHETLGIRRTDETEMHDLQRYGVWSPEFQTLNLPSYRTLYLFLCRMPMDVIRESLCIRLEQKPAEPSALSIRQLMQEFKEGLKVGVICKQKYLRDVRAVQTNEDEDFPHHLLEKEFNEILKQTLNAYLDYLQRWVGMGSLTNHFQKNALELEWNFTRSVCSAIPGGEMLAGNAFCTIACSMLNSTGRYLKDGIHQRLDCQCDSVDTSGSETDDQRLEKDTALCVLRRIQRVLSEAREQCLKAVCVAKMIRRDLEVAAEFDVRMPLQTLLQRLAETEHVQVVWPHSDNYVVFVPEFLRDQKEYMHCLLDLSSRSECRQQSTDGADTSSHSTASVSENTNPENEGYMILMQAPANRESTTELWQGETVKFSDLRDDAILRSHVQRDVLLLVVFNAIHLSKRRRELQEMLGPGLELRYENRPSNYVVAESLLQLKNELINLSETIIAAIQEIVDKLNVNNYSALVADPCEQAPLVSRWREVVRHAFKLGFEFNRDVLRLVSGKPSVELALNVVKLAKFWMHFTVRYCERGRGLRPKWAAQGLDFLVIASESEITCHLADDEFTELKELIGQCVCHVVGSLEQHKALKVPTSTAAPLSRRRSRLSSSALQSPIGTPDSFTPFASPRPSRRPSVNTMINTSNGEPNVCLTDLNGASLAWKERVKRSSELVDTVRDSIMEDANLIGHVSRVTREAKWHARLKSVQFSWQRGVKIGQGRFGKVYVAVNNQTGELMAMKEIALQPNDHRTIRSVADELRIFEGINHPHLVKYYGVEIHREEMYIFMEFCPEGTLEQLVSSTEAGLPEELIRRYTRQLLEAVAVLHRNGIVHRDIKGANIFLYDSGNCLKLGDFGCAAKIKSHTTMAGELQGFVGTQAFMAPEVFMHSLAEGHGRAADIWSVGCVVIEMATGKRPWYELESNYAIMFKVGMGEVPPTPATLSEEGKAFLSLMLQHDPKLRETAANLLEHNFLKVYQEE